MRLSILLLSLGLLAVCGQNPPAAAESEKPLPRLNAPLGNAGPEPTLQVILNRLGYSIDVTRDEIDAQLFRRSGRKPAVHRPISAFGLLENCASGWYSLESTIPPRKHPLWTIEGPKNKQDQPPLATGSKTAIPPKMFGLWVSTAGFPKETVYTQDFLQRYSPRFPETDRHKVRIFPAKTSKGLIKNAYILCWEYSTNNDFQDVITRLENAQPVQLGQSTHIIIQQP